MGEHLGEKCGQRWGSFVVSERCVISVIEVNWASFREGREVFGDEKARALLRDGRALKR